MVIGTSAGPALWAYSRHIPPQTLCFRVHRMRHWEGVWAEMIPGRTPFHISFIIGWSGDLEQAPVSDTKPSPAPDRSNVQSRKLQQHESARPSERAHRCTAPDPADPRQLLWANPARIGGERSQNGMHPTYTTAYGAPLRAWLSGLGIFCFSLTQRHPTHPSPLPFPSSPPSQAPVRIQIA